MSLPPISLLDLAFVGEGETVRDALAGCVALARRAEAMNLRRIWYAEHHNIQTIASSATAVLIAHVAAHTERIRLGAGGIMLPNHAPLVIAEQFGTLAALHPDRIDLGLGRAPGTDQVTLQALRRTPSAAETFPQDLLELQGYLSGQTRIPGIHATPGKGTNVPLYVLGSSLFGAQLAAKLGLPYAFASHFAPAYLHQAVTLYRERFEPSDQLDRPHVIAGVNVIAADSQVEAQRQQQLRRRTFARSVFRQPGHELDEAQLDAILSSPQGAQIDQMFVHTAMGPPDEVRAGLQRFQEHAGADELMVVLQAPTVQQRLHALELLGQAIG